MSCKYKLLVALFACAFSAFLCGCADQYGGAVGGNTSGSAIKIVVPRLWRVQPFDDGTTIYILGLTHFGLPFEYDGYLDETIVPAISKAVDIYYENGGGIDAEKQPSCGDSGPATPEAVASINELKGAVKREVAAYYMRAARVTGKSLSTDFPVKLADTYVDQLSEFSLYSLFVNYYNLLTQPNMMPPNGIDGEGNVVEYLAKTHSNVVLKSIDQPDTLARVYCSMGQQRYVWLSVHVRTFDHKNDIHYSKNLARRNSDKAELDIRGAIANQSSLTGISDLAGTAEGAFVCKRNALWKEEMLSQHDGKTHIYAVGFAHLFGYDDMFDHCNGLISDLRQSEHPVQLIL